MSRQAEQRVWERSRAKGSNLLVLVKLADWANEEGFDAFPSPQRLAAATRLTDRGLRYILHRLERAGEILIEPNTEGRALTIGKRTIRPAWFIHVRCVCEWDAYQAEGESEKFASQGFRPGRRRRDDEPEKIADPPAGATGKDFPATGTPVPQNRKNHVPAYKEGSLRDLLVVQEQGAEQGLAPPFPFRPIPPTASPDDALAVITRLVHDTFETLGPPYARELPEFTDVVKSRCAELHIPYDARVVAKAIDSATWQRRRAQAVS